MLWKNNLRKSFSLWDERRHPSLAQFSTSSYSLSRLIKIWKFPLFIQRSSSEQIENVHCYLKVHSCVAKMFSIFYSKLMAPWSSAEVSLEHNFHEIFSSQISHSYVNFRTHIYNDVNHNWNSKPHSPCHAMPFHSIILI